MSGFWHIYRYFYTAVFFCFIIFIFMVKTAQASNNTLHIEAAPGWIEYRSLPPVNEIPIGDLSNGIFYRLLDNQIHVTESGYRTLYSRYTESIVNQTGVKNGSQINITFDPVYQRLALNTLFILRDGQQIDKLQTAKISMLNSENELDDQIYNGSLTMSILIDDVREGDTLDYSYTRYGMNPIYEGIFSYSRLLNWSVPVFDQYLRVLWGKSTQLYIKTRNSSPQIEENKVGKYTEYQVHIHDADIITEPSQVPYWYSPYGSIYLSEVEKWREVVDWAKPLYNFNSVIPEVLSIAKEIKRQHKELPAQIVSALKYVQDNIRYVALQNGINSHLPTPPSETLTLRYGDCKDKAILLISLLNALDIEAYPALVNTEETKLLFEKPPALNYFDHVLVTLIYNKKRLWLDPTLRFQEGSLSTIYQPDYGYALVLKSDQNSLLSMAQDKSNSYTHVKEQYVIPENVNERVTLVVDSEYLGNPARNKRSQIERDGMSKLTKDYEIYYQRTYPHLVSNAEVKVIQDKVTGVLKLTEKYFIDDFWIEEGKDYEVEFYPTDVRNAVFKPKQTNRNAPLSLAYPSNIKNNIQVKFEQKGWNFEKESFVEDNAYFLFKKDVSFENNTLSLNFEYSAKSDHIPADKIEEYLAARTRLREQAYFGLIKYGENKNTELAEDISIFPLWIKVVGLYYLVLFGGIIISWRLESRRRPTFEDSHFYPISLWKFLTLSIISFGFYLTYWMYRNWKAIKLKDEIQIMPIARGFFSLFWFFPLFENLKADSIRRFGTNKVMATFLAILFSITYLLISGLSSYSEHYGVVVASLFVPVLFIPLVNYVNLLNGDKSCVYRYNSQWCIRHTLTLLIGIPLIALTLASESSLLPSDKVVTQEGIMTHDMKFLYRKKILPADEQINYFYSSGTFTVRDDGNGFTDNRVFSYWLDDNDRFKSEIAPFDRVKDIKVEFAKDSDSDTIITITRLDNSDFMLFVSTVDARDKLFVTKLNERWKKINKI